MTLKANSRMNRVKVIGTLFKYLFLGAIVFFAFQVADTLFTLSQLTPDSHIMGQFWYTDRGDVTLRLEEFVGGAVCFWFCYKFFGACSRGEPFTSRNVRYLQAAGCTYFLFYPVEVFRIELSERVMHTVDHFPSGVIYLPLSWQLLPPVIFSLFPGVFIIFTAWIMDEGRKIQEEQELTV